MHNSSSRVRLTYDARRVASPHESIEPSAKLLVSDVDVVKDVVLSDCESGMAHILQMDYYVEVGAICLRR